MLETNALFEIPNVLAGAVACVSELLELSSDDPFLSLWTRWRERECQGCFYGDGGGTHDEDGESPVALVDPARDGPSPAADDGALHEEEEVLGRVDVVVVEVWDRRGKVRGEVGVNRARREGD